MTDQEQQLVDNIVKQLDQSIAGLDRSIQSRLAQVRQQAIDAARARISSLGQADLLHSIQGQLEADNEAVPAEIETRLNEIRRQALAKAAHLQRGRKPDSSGMLQRYWSSILENLRLWPSAAIASACVAVIAVSMFTVFPRAGDEVSLSDEINLLASADDIELYENLDFYLWLAENGISN